MNNPGTILKLWNKAVLMHEQGKKAAEMPKKGQEQKVKIKKNLTQIKFQAMANMQDPTHRGAFVKMQSKLVRLMKQYCVQLKKGTDEDKKTLPKWLKTVKQLTVLVENLDPGALETTEEEPGLDSIKDVDVAALDQALAVPGANFDEDNEQAASPALQEIAATDDQSTDWRVARSDAIKQIRALQTQLARTKDAEAADIVRLLQTIIDQLPENLDSAAGVAALEQYIRTDEIVATAQIANPFGVNMTFRNGLLKALTYAKNDLKG